MWLPVEKTVDFSLRIRNDHRKGKASLYVQQKILIHPTQLNALNIDIFVPL